MPFVLAFFYFFQDPPFPFLPKEKRIAADEKKEKEGRNLLLFFLARIYEQFPLLVRTRVCFFSVQTRFFMFPPPPFGRTCIRYCM